MAFPLEISGKDVPVTETLEALIRKHVQKLARFHGRILGCRVVVEGPGRHHRRGRCKVHVSLSIPGRDVQVTRQGGTDFAVGLREAFNAATRRLEDHVRRTRGYVKIHAPKPEVAP